MVKILNNYWRSLFDKPEVLTTKDNPIKKYNIYNPILSLSNEIENEKNNIEYTPESHWTVYDFINNKIYKKSQNREFFIFSSLPNKYSDELGNECDFSVLPQLEELNYKSRMKLECKLKSRSILAIFDESFINDYKLYGNEELEDRIFYCVYQTYLTNKIVNKTLDEIQNLEYNLIPNVNWIWFKKESNQYLHPKILTRAKSMIKENPSFEFHFWTNLETKEDIVKYFEKADPNQEFINQSNFIIHYKDETYSIVAKFFDNNKSDIKYDWEFYKQILDNEEDYTTMVYKTDVIRCIILSLNGGWYADFNDIYCFVPLKYLVNGDPRTKEYLYFGCDELDCHNNYLLYSPPNHNTWKETTLIVLNNSLNMYDDLYLINNIELVNQFIKIKDDLCNKMQKLIDAGSNEIYLVEMITEELVKWDQEFRHIKTNFGKYNLLFHDKSLINIFALMYDKINPKSELKNKLFSEINDVLMIRKNIINKYVIWKNNKTPETKWILKQEDVDQLRNLEFDYKFITNSMIYMNVTDVMNRTNIGCMFSLMNKEKKEDVYQISNCHAYDNYTFLTVIGHLGDATCTGKDNAYSNQILL